MFFTKRMNTILIFIWVYAAMIATSFWESYSEGENAGYRGKHGWKIKLSKYYLTGYHFFLFFVMFPLLLSLPLVIYGWDTRLFGILLSAYVSGLIIEDFMWYVVSPKVSLKELNPEFANYYPWITFKKFRIPALYILGALVAVLAWYVLWR